MFGVSGILGLGLGGEGLGLRGMTGIEVEGLGSGLFKGFG